MGLEHITSLNDLNVALKNTLEQVHTASKDPITISWGGAGRKFTLVLKDNSTITVKMTDILAKFEELVEKSQVSPQDKKLIGDICDRIVELDFEGDVKLNQEGSIGLRNFFHLFQTSHLSVIDYIEKKYLLNNYNVDKKKTEFLRAMGNESTYKDLLIQALNNPNDSNTGFGDLTLTISALRAIVITNPTEAKEILNSLKSIVDKIDPLTPNPNEEIEVFRESLDALTIDVNSRGLFRDDEIKNRTKEQHVLRKPKELLKPDFKKLKEYEDYGHSYEWIPGELAVKFTYENSRSRTNQKKVMEEEIKAAAEKSLYVRPPVKLTEISPSNLLSQTQLSLKLNTEDVFFLLGKGLSKTQFNTFLCQEIWDDIERKYGKDKEIGSIDSQIKAQQTSLLHAMIEKLPDEIIENFFTTNQIDLANERFYLTEGTGPSRLASNLKKNKPQLFAKLMSELETKDSAKHKILS